MKTPWIIACLLAAGLACDGPVSATETENLNLQVLPSPG